MLFLLLYHVTICSKYNVYMLFIQFRSRGIFLFVLLLNFNVLADALLVYFEIGKAQNKDVYVFLSYYRENQAAIFIRTKNINHLFCIAAKLMGTCELHLLLLFNGTQINDNE